ncbi:hypothetical protein [Streptomyces sp. MBT27]|uniref:hypothetical protein n=1 Tax=Streptomyces sp. MBT27 TaxID=1488356 RepID=UPI0014246FC3|nr:hypothetical protein [Streptomyces sp. MBT27]
MIMGWGRTAGILLAAAAVFTVAGCGGDASAEAEPSSAATGSARPAGPTLAEAERMYQEDIGALRVSGCPASCGREIVEVYNNALLVRKLMRDDTTVRAGAYAEAYRLIDLVEQGFILRQGVDNESTRAPVLSPAYELSRWLKTHPAG